MYEALYAQNKGLLIAMARRYAGACAMDRAVSEEDLVQSGFLGLVRAARTFDRSGGRSWASWASWHIQRSFEQALCLRQGRRIQAHSGADTLDRPLDTANEAGETAGDLLVDETLPDPDAGLLLEELRRDVRNAVDRLKDGDERRAATLCLLEERSLPEVAGAMGVSVRQARRLNARACRRLFQDRRLRARIDLDERTRFVAHKGVAGSTENSYSIDWGTVNSNNYKVIEEIGRAHV